MDAYAFISRASEETIEQIAEVSGVRTVAQPFTGPYEAIAFLEADDERALQEIFTAIRNAGAAGSLDRAVALVPAVSSLLGPLFPTRWLLKQDFAGYARIRVDGGMADDVLLAASELEGFQGAASVSGSFDVFVEIGGVSSLAIGHAMEELRRMEGVRWVKASISTAPPLPADQE